MICTKFIKYTKYAGILFLSFSLIACTPNHKDITNSSEFNLPDGLKDCKVYRLRDNLGTLFTVFRCPISTVQIKKSGKYPINTTVIQE